MNRQAGPVRAKDRRKDAESAVIDIGSNTVRLVIYGDPARAPTALLNEKVVARLGRDLESTGNIPNEAMAMALTALRRYALILEDRGISEVDVVATAAARDAKNGPEFVEKIRKIGLTPRLLSGEEEARAAAAGVAGAFPGATGLVADLGGGSLELISLEDGVSGQGTTLPLGTLRLGKLRESGESEFSAKVASLLGNQPWADVSAGALRNLYLVGGTLRCLAAYVIRSDSYPLTDPHGFELSAQRAKDVAAMVAKMSPEELGRIDGIASNRAEILPDAAAMLAIMLDKFAPERVIFSSWGLREGLLYGKLDPLSRDQDPLLTGVSHFVRERGVDPSVATQLAAWCAGAVADRDARDNRWQLAATMLSLAAARVEPNWRARHALDWAMFKRWIALSAEHRGQIAAALLASCGVTQMPEAIKQIAPKTGLKQAVTWGLAIRLCRRMTAGTQLSLLTSKLQLGDGQLVLTLDTSRADLRGIGVEKDLRNLASWLGVESAIVTGSLDS